MSSSKGTDSEIKDSTPDERQVISTSTSTVREVGAAPCSSDASAQKIKEDYKEPWVTNFCLTPLFYSHTHARTKALRLGLLIAMQNYEQTYYPTTLPWRKPYSCDPGMLLDAFENISTL